jgi:hypothetical protein
VAWSIFTDGGGNGAALTWAQDLLKRIGAPLTAGNEQFIYDWEVSEGGGGKYNPLNQGPVPGNPSLTTTGQQYGGGAADFKSWAAGLTGAADYLAMPAYQGVADALRSNQPETARQSLISSPWAASHYGYGSSFSGQPIPGKASALAAGGGAAGSGTSAGSSNPLDVLANLPSTLSHIAIVGPIVVLGGALVVLGAAKATGMNRRAGQAAETVSKAAPAAAVI